MGIYKGYEFSSLQFLKIWKISVFFFFSRNDRKRQGNEEVARFIKSLGRKSTKRERKRERLAFRMSNDIWTIVSGRDSTSLTFYTTAHHPCIALVEKYLIHLFLVSHNTHTHTEQGGATKIQWRRHKEIIFKKSHK